MGTLSNFFGILFMCSAAMVAFSRNPIHSIIFLLIAFFSAAGLLMLLATEFIALTLIIVYVGAIAILFLFIIMMLKIKNKDTTPINTSVLRYLSIVGVSLFITLKILSGNTYHKKTFLIKFITDNGKVSVDDGITSAEGFGQSFYNGSSLFLIIGGLLLLVALIGAVVLTSNICLEGLSKRQM